jgi:chloramphenicol-sensitive protein RarD
MQYLGPTIQFLLGLWLFGEPLTPNRLIGFTLIWIALVIYTADGLRAHKAPALAADAASPPSPPDLSSPRSPAPPR